ncbi:hypothetical protein J3458_009279 [Metarhizium acridum]|uniref:uncharacterized protein n=1 Tax=Metarhizium acridum TaxID=92637 RepID=UPI001C6BFB54|nr:hypothetical protein J3458_009279 [Metarhizium acridum]
MDSTLARSLRSTRHLELLALLKALFLLVDKEVDKEPGEELDGQGVSKILYASHHFKKYVKEKWLQKTPNEGSFVLMHGNMAAVVANPLFDDDLTMVLVVWEWSQVL